MPALVDPEYWYREVSVHVEKGLYFLQISLTFGI